MQAELVMLQKTLGEEETARGQIVIARKIIAGVIVYILIALRVMLLVIVNGAAL